jgi:hypothetical protein
MYEHYLINRTLLTRVSLPHHVQKFTEFYETRKLITVFTTVRHLFLSWATLVQSAPSQQISLPPILIIFSHLRPCLQSAHFLSDFPTITLYTPLTSPHTCRIPSPSIIIDMNTRIIERNLPVTEEQNTEFFLIVGRFRSVYKHATEVWILRTVKFNRWRQVFVMPRFFLR